MHSHQGRDVLVQERIPGVALAVAWQYISQAQKESFKLQARTLLRQLQTIQPPNSQKHRSYIVPDPEPVRHRCIQDLERHIIFGEDKRYYDLSFMHDDLSKSNIIVNGGRIIGLDDGPDNGRIVGLVDWEMAGYIGRRTAGIVHTQIRSPNWQNYASLSLSKEFLDDIMFWNDVYE